MLAIIIPYYKYLFFEVTLKSLANQRDKRFKVYIGDDASPEEPSGLLEKYKGQFDFLYHRFETNRGAISLTEQWERCISLSNNEEWLMILGDDDYLDDTVVESWYKHYDFFNHKSNVIRFATKTIDQKTERISKVFTHPVLESAIDSFYRRFQGNTRSSLSEYIFSKKTFLKYKFRDYPLAWHSDDKAWLDFSDGKPIFTINDSVVFIRISDFSITGKSDNSELKNLAVIKFLKDIISYQFYLITKEQRLEVLYNYERALCLSRQITIIDWGKLGKLYLENFNPNFFVKFLKRFLKNGFQIWNS